ncbi:MAG TPA: SpoIID/LytB domain-containing protein [Longimicrobiaceae bacterium]|nr:SpoIID/LytB domain-containing protein [Longimicrobiaceae bacterium]
MRTVGWLAPFAILTACADRVPTGPSAAPAFNESAVVEADTGDIYVDESRGEESEAGGISTLAFNGLIRIGVVPAASTVRIGGTGEFQVRNKSTGALLLTGNNEQVDVTLASTTVTTSSRRLQVVCTPSVADRDAWVARGDAAGFPTYYVFFTSPTINCWRVFIGERPLPANTAAEAAYRNQVRAAIPSVPADAFWRTVTITTGVTQYVVTWGSTSVTSPAPVVLTPVTGLATIGTPASTRRYRGVAEVIKNSSLPPNQLAGVNELPIEQYLYGVVPRELGPIAFPELEALKAQAVAARTYALSGLGKRSSDGYDLLPTTADQVYGGYQDEHPLSNQAVDETAGVVATYNGSLISTLYSSANGGFSANNEEVFNAPPAAYLRGRPDAERGQAFEHVPSLEVFRRHANPVSLRNTGEGDFESDWSRFHRWTFEWTMAEISQVISAYAQQPVGKVLAINVTERGPSGRVMRIEYVTEAGTFTDTRDRIRSSLKYINASGTPTSLLSTLFFIEPLTDPSSKELAGYRVYGGGFGHGVGMSQTGAVGMAEKGHSYEQILKHYYTGIELNRWY